MTKHDQTFSDRSAFGSEAWCAATIGRSTDWFYRNRERLETAGFPRRDPVVKMRLKSDVEAWLARRRQISDSVEYSTNQKMGVNYDAF